MSKPDGEGESGPMQETFLEALPLDKKKLDIGTIRTSVLEGGQGQPVVLMHGGIQAGGAVAGSSLGHRYERS